MTVSESDKAYLSNSPAFTLEIEAETALSLTSSSVLNNQPNFSGNSYVDFGFAGAEMELNPVELSGTVTKIDIYYSQGNGNRLCELQVTSTSAEGTLEITADVFFTFTGGWDVIEKQETFLNLQPGTVSIKLVSVASYGCPNIDKYVIYQ